MKLKDIIATKDALKRLSELRLTYYKKMREVVKLRKAVEAEFDCYAAEEKKCVYAYAEMRETGTPAFLPDGRLKLKDAEAKAAFEKELSALLETEVDDITPVHLGEKDFRSTDELPSPDDMIKLEGLIILED